MATLQLTNEYNSLGGIGGTCCLCNSAKRTEKRAERIVTTDQVTDMLDAPPGVWPEQWMEFCESCVTEMGRLVGMTSEEQAEQLYQTIVDHQLKIDELEAFVAELKNDISALETVNRRKSRTADKVEA